MLTAVSLILGGPLTPFTRLSMMYVVASAFWSGFGLAILSLPIALLADCLFATSASMEANRRSARELDKQLSRVPGAYRETSIEEAEDALIDRSDINRIKKILAPPWWMPTWRKRATLSSITVLVPRQDRPDLNLLPPQIFLKSDGSSVIFLPSKTDDDLAGEKRRFNLLHEAEHASMHGIAFANASGALKIFCTAFTLTAVWLSGGSLLTITFAAIYFAFCYITCTSLAPGNLEGRVDIRVLCAFPSRDRRRMATDLGNKYQCLYDRAYSALKDARWSKESDRGEKKKTVIKARNYALRKVVIRSALKYAEWIDAVEESQARKEALALERGDTAWLMPTLLAFVLSLWLVIQHFESLSPLVFAGVAACALGAVMVSVTRYRRTLAAATTDLPAVGA